VSAVKTLNLIPGQRIENVAVRLCALAPARAAFNGIWIRAKYATTKARDIVAYYRRCSDERLWRGLGKADRAASDAIAIGPCSAKVPAR
jgi:hypothetical protein